MNDATEFHRSNGGSIDYGFYRAQAAALRRQAMRERSARRAVGAGLLGLTGAVVVLVLIAATPQPPIATAQSIATQLR
jgi:hypothetical protein